MSDVMAHYCIVFVSVVMAHCVCVTPFTDQQLV